jgi:hypothetical protein
MRIRITAPQEIDLAGGFADLSISLQVVADEPPAQPGPDPAPPRDPDPPVTPDPEPPEPPVTTEPDPPPAPPAPPRVPYGTVYQVRKGVTARELQGIFDRLVPGDEVVIDNAVEVAGQFTLPQQPIGSKPIVIRAANVPTGTPQGADGLPVFKTAGPASPGILTIGPGARGYTLMGLAFVAKHYAYSLLTLGSGKESDPTQLPGQILVERCYFSGSLEQGTRRAITANCAGIFVKNVKIENIWDQVDNQGIACWNGVGPFQIIDSAIEAMGENIMFGGSPSAVKANPSGIIIARNKITKSRALFKQLTGQGKRVTVKNLIELKRAENVLIEENTLDGSWTGQQNGEAFVFTVRGEHGANPWAAIRNVYVVRNKIIRCGAGVNMLGRDYNSGMVGVCENVTFTQNLFVIDPSMGRGFGFQLLTGTENVSIERNTVVAEGPSALKFGIVLDGPPGTPPGSPGWVAEYPHKKLKVIGNVFGGPVFGRGLPAGDVPVQKFAPGATFEGNVAFGGPVPNARVVKIAEAIRSDYLPVDPKTGAPFGLF